MRRRALVWLLALGAVLLSAVPIPRDRVHSQRVAPGVVHRWWVDPAGPWAIHVLEVELSGRISLMTVKAEERLHARETVSAMAERKRRAGLRVLAGVNGDFFYETGEPVGIQVCQGTLLKNPSHRSAFVVTEAGRPFITPLALRMMLIGSSGESVRVARVNDAPRADEMALYNRYAGTSVAFRSPTAVARCLLLDSLRVGRTIRLVCVELDTGVVSASLSGGQVLLAARGRATSQLVSTCGAGDTLRLWIRLIPDLGSPIMEAVGGLPRIVRDGEVSIEVEREGGSGFRDVRHPRTAVGISANGRRVYLVTVDGRQEGYSVGMTLPELAQLMLELGAYQALNLDGGGSTTLVVDGQVVNRPSDPTGERPVANAILVVMRP